MYLISFQPVRAVTPILRHHLRHLKRYQHYVIYVKLIVKLFGSSMRKRPQDKKDDRYNVTTSTRRSQNNRVHYFHITGFAHIKKRENKEEKMSTEGKKWVQTMYETVRTPSSPTQPPQKKHKKNTTNANCHS